MSGKAQLPKLCLRRSQGHNQKDPSIRPEEETHGRTGLRTAFIQEVQHQVGQVYPIPAVEHTESAASDQLQLLF